MSKKSSSYDTVITSFLINLSNQSFSLETINMDLLNRLQLDRSNILKTHTQCLPDLESHNLLKENEILRWVELGRQVGEYDLETLKGNFKFENDRFWMKDPKLKEDSTKKKNPLRTLLENETFQSKLLKMSRDSVRNLNLKEWYPQVRTDLQ